MGASETQHDSNRGDDRPIECASLDAQTLDPSLEDCLPPAEQTPPGTPPEAPPSGTARVRLTPDGRLTTGRLKGMTMGRAMWVLCWPVLIESYLNWFVGVVDTKLSANLSVAAADAVGPASYFMWFIGLIGMSLGVGATAVIARSIGKGRTAVANAAVGQTVVLALLSGAVVGVLLAMFASRVGRIVSLEGEALSLFTDYLVVVALGVPASASLVAGIACLRGAGDSIGPLIAMAIVNVINIATSWGLSGVPLFGIASPFGIDMGITGIACGTVVAHAVGALLVLWMLRGGKSGVRLLARRLRPHRVTMSRILRIGLPNFFESLGMWLGNFFIVLFVGWIAASGGGEGTFGAHIIAIRIEAVSFLPGFAIGMATATLVGQYLGAGSPTLAKAAIMRAALVAGTIMALMGLLFIVFPGFITWLMSREAVHAELVPPLLVICGCVQIPFAIALVVRSALRGAGDAKVVMWLTWITTYAVRIPLAYLVSGVDIMHRVQLADGTEAWRVLIENPSPFDGGLTGLWIALCSELVIRGGVFAARYVQGGWINARV